MIYEILWQELAEFNKEIKEKMRKDTGTSESVEYTMWEYLNDMAFKYSCDDFCGLLS